MFDVGFSEILIIIVLVLIVVGPKKLPEAARTIGKFFAKAREVSDELKSEIRKELDSAEKPDISDIAPTKGPETYGRDYQYPPPSDDEKKKEEKNN